MTEARDISALINTLTGNGSGEGANKKLPPAATPPAIPSRAGKSAPKVPDKRASSGGIAGPLTETAYADRTFHPERTLTTPDGIFTVAYRPLKSVKMKDVNAAEVVFEFKAPPA